MTRVSYPLSPALPELFRRRGQGALATLLGAVDAAWGEVVSPRSLAAVWDWSDQFSLGEWSRLFGWDFLIQEAGGIERVTYPSALRHLPQAAVAGTEELVRFWVHCLFGLTVTQITSERDLLGHQPPQARVALAGCGTEFDPTVVYRVIRRLLPAHWAFAPEGLIWENHTMEAAVKPKAST